MATGQNFRVDSFVSGLAIKAPVKTVSLVDIPTLSGSGGNIGGYIVSVGDRVLLAAQTDPIDNGIYNVETSAWNRAGDMDGNRDIVGGTIVPVWRQAMTDVVLYQIDGVPDPIIIGQDSIPFSLYYDPSTSVEVDTLQSVTTRGNTTDAGIISDADIIVQNGNILRVQDSDADETQIYWAADQFLISPGIGGKNLNLAIFDYTFMQETRQVGAAYIFEQAAADANVAQYGQVWVNSVPNPHELMFTNDNGDDINLTTELWDNGTRQILSNSLGAAVRVALFIGDDDNGFGAGFGSLYIADRASAGADFAGQGQFWVRDTLDGEPMFTDDQGVDSVLNATLASSVAGAKAYHNANQVIGGAGADVVLAFNQEAYDTDTIHDTVTNNSRLTVPAGVTRIKLRGNIRWQTSASSYRSITIRKNGAGGTIDDAMTWQPRVEMTANIGPNSWDQQIETGVITVAATDYFELLVRQGSGGNLNAESSETWFEMELIE